jgi:hypothetical protein
MELKKQILEALGLNKEEELQLGFQAKTDDGTIMVSTAEELEAGVDISVLTEDGTTIPLPPGTYKLDTGVSFRVEDEGIVAEVLQSETEEKEEVEVEAAEDESPAEKADWAESYEHLKDRVNNLENAIHDIKEKLGEGDAEEMSEEIPEEAGENPKTVTTKTTEVVEFSAEQMESLEEELENLTEENRKLKTELAKEPAEAPLNTNKFSSERTALSRKELNRLSRQERILYNLNK